MHYAQIRKEACASRRLEAACGISKTEVVVAGVLAFHSSKDVLIFRVDVDVAWVEFRDSARSDQVVNSLVDAYIAHQSVILTGRRKGSRFTQISVNGILRRNCKYHLSAI